MKIWLILKGKEAKLGKIEVLKFVNVLLNFQRFIFDYGMGKGIRKREYLKICITKVSGGSVEVEMIPKIRTLQSVPFQAIDFINNLNENLDDLEKSKRIITNEFKQDGDLIVRCLSKLKAFWSQDSLKVQLGKGIGKPDTIIQLKSENRINIDRLLKEFMKQYAQSVKGVILESKFYGSNRHFEVITPSGERIRCYYNHLENPELEDTIYEHIKKTVEVVGFLEEKGHRKTIKDVLEVKSWDKIEITNEIAGYKLKKPILLKIEYDNFDNIWCIENEEFELYGCGSTLEEAKKVVEMVFEALIEEYLYESDEKLSDGAKKLKTKLMEHVEVSRLWSSL